MPKLRYLPIVLASLTACDLSPDYTLPDLQLPNLFKEAPATPTEPIPPVTDGSWKLTDDRAKIEEFAWWRLFADENLNAMEALAMKDNPDLDAALARVKKARAVAEETGADQYPAVSIGVGPERQQASRGAVNAGANGAFTIPKTKPYTLYKAQGTITYDLDLFGRNRNRTAAATRDANAEENNYRAARLLLQVEVAQAYFSLASLQAEKDILTQTVDFRQQTIALTRQKRDVGEVDDLALSTAETELATAQADLAVVDQQRAVEEHSLAALTGALPAVFVMPKALLDGEPPAVPAGLPAALLERRPDIKQAVEQIAAANARIGVARTGYFPDISLTAQGGFASDSLSNLFAWSNRTWLLGSLVGTVLTQPVFEGGRLSAAIAESKADYQEAVANYRVAVLQAFREVEDQLSNVRTSAERQRANEAALKAARRAFDVAKQRYEVGNSSHLEYLDAQRSLLAAERATVQSRGDRFIATAQLIKALGGSWEQPGDDSAK